MQGLQIRSFFSIHESRGSRCICVEHWLRSCETVVVDGYTSLSLGCRGHTGYEGTLILVRSSVIHREVVLDVPYLDKHFEYSVGECMTCGTRILLVAVYRSPDGRVDVFFRNLEHLLYLIFSGRDVLVIVGGDFNLNILDKSNKNVMVFLDIMSSFNLTPANMEMPTYETATSSTNIDNIFIPLNSEFGCDVFAPGFSDHRAVRCILKNLIKSTPTTNSYVGRSFNQNNLKDFCNYVSTCDWNDVYDEPVPENKYTQFHDQFMHFFNASFPFKKYYVNKNKRDKRWVTPDIAQGAGIARVLHENYRSSSDSLDRFIYINYMRVHRKNIELAKKAYFGKCIVNSANPTKSAWKVINENVKPSADNRIALQLKDGLTCDEALIVKAFRNLFVLKSAHLENNINTVDILNIRHNSSMYLTPVSTVEVYNIIMKIKNSSSRDIYEVPSCVLKICAVHIAPVVAYLINTSFERGQFPHQLKVAKIVPIFKKGDKTDQNNYRPISILPIISKVFEKCFASRLLDFFKSHNLLTPSQFGFLPGSSTVDAIYSFLNTIKGDLDVGMKPLGIFFDFSKAFDTVDFSRLLGKLYRYGVRGKPYEWIKSYLSDRSQIVALSTGHKSLPSSTECGVPQGSILGPLLFLIYANDLAKFMGNVKVCQYADDTSVSISSQTLSELTLIANETVRRMEEWSKLNGLKLNTNKTQAMHFSLRGNLDYAPYIRSSERSLEVVSSVRFLGMHIDPGLDWSVHLQVVSSSLASLNFLILRLRSIISYKYLQIFYYAHVETRMRYGLIFWGQAPYFERIFRLQKRVIRSMHGVGRFESCVPLFRETGLLTLPALYIYECALYVKSHPQQFARLGDVRNNYSTRNANLLLYPKHETASFEKGASYACIRIYNHLPSAFRSLPLKQFKRSLKNHLAQKVYYSLNDFFQDQH